MLKKITAFTIALALMCGTAYSADISDTETGMLDLKKIADIKMDQSYSYLNHLKNHPDAADVTGRVTVNAADYTAKSGEDIKILENYEGKSRVLEWSSGGFAEWKFSVPKSGFYQVDFSYFPLLGKGKPIELAMEVNGQVQFRDMTSFFLPRCFEDDFTNIDPEAHNQFAPPQKAKLYWMSSLFRSADGLIDGGLRVFFEEGENSIKLLSADEPFVLESITLGCQEAAVSYKEYISKYDKSLSGGSGYHFIEGEGAARKSAQSLVPSTDLTSPLTQPKSDGGLKINMIGRNWSQNGQWLEWDFDVAETGLYKLSFRYRQNYLKGFVVSRKLYLDGEVPFKEAENISFSYQNDWDGVTLKASDSEDMYFYIEKGKHTLRLEAICGPIGECVARLDETLYELESLYRKIIMITGVLPDSYRDYNLDREIPGLIESFTRCRDSLNREYKNIQEINQSLSREASILELLSVQLDSLIREPHKIALRLQNFNGNIGGFAAWILDLRYQPIDIDYLRFSKDGAPGLSYKANFFEQVGHEFTLFINSFFEDYNTIGGSSGEQKKITLWLGAGRDQAQVLSMMTRDMFTAEHGAFVDIKLISSSMVESFLSNQSPDVAIMIGRSLPANLAARGALLDLAQFEDFDEVKKRFTANATKPFEYRGGVYAIPDSLYFFMTFYRKDIFKELGLEPPVTWDDFYSLVGEIQRNKMDVGLPYSVVDAWGSVDSGMGTRNILPALVYQNGGRFYKDDLSETAFDEEIMQTAFKEWTDLYTKYRLPLTYDFYNRFRTGQMPLAIAGYSSYSQFVAAAPEISGLWGMVPIPGTEKSDGSIDITQAGASTASVILSKTKDKDASWDFIKWWTAAKTQVRYSNDMKSRLGEMGYHSVANTEAMSMLSWNANDLKNLNTQMASIREIPEVLGSYYTVRGIDNAFRAVLYDYQNPIEALGNWNKQINNELSRKREEFGVAN